MSLFALWARLRFFRKSAVFSHKRMWEAAVIRDGLVELGMRAWVSVIVIAIFIMGAFLS